MIFLNVSECVAVEKKKKSIVHNKMSQVTRGNEEKIAQVQKKKNAQQHIIDSRRRINGKREEKK